MKRPFIINKNNYVIIHFFCPLWFSRLFGTAGHAIEFVLFKNVLVTLDVFAFALIGLFFFISLLMDSHQHHWDLTWEFTEQLQYLESTDLFHME